MIVIQHTNRDILLQIRDLLRVASQEAYSLPLELLHGSSVGQHIRHTLEFYQCLFEQAPLGFIDYDTRNRNLLLETDVAFGLAFTEQLLTHLQPPLTDSRLVMHLCLAENEPQRVQTTLARELVYMAEHAIHHLAIIKIALRAHFPDIALPAHFGVAYSTIKHQKSIQN